MKTTTGLIRITPQGKLTCPVCGKNHGCAIMKDRDAVLCIRVEQGCARRADGTPIIITEGGLTSYVHRLGKEAARKIPALPSAKPTKKLTASECRQMQKQFVSAVNPQRLKSLSDSLGLSIRSLERLGIGWDWRTTCWTFPMSDGRQRIIGFRTRDGEGNKRCIRGSNVGLFIPLDYDNPPEESWPQDNLNQLLILAPEGPTDTAAAMDMGFMAVGRPDNRNGVEQLKELLTQGPKQNVIIVADHDQTKWAKDADGKRVQPLWPGQEGALHVAEGILPLCHTLRVIEPPVAIKDLRAWLAKGATYADFWNLAAKANFVTEEWIREEYRRFAQYRRRLTKLKAA